MTITRNKRETGFEILRILAMFLIGAVHIMNYGGMLANNAPHTVMWQKLIYSVFVVSVNVFVLISAYFMVTSKFKVKRILNLWLQVLVFSVGSYLIASLFFYNSFSFEGLINSCLPVLNNRFWFFTAYFLLMLTSPFLNKILNNSSKKELWLLVCGLLLIVFLGIKMPVRDVFNVSYGYSFLWFCILYLLAGTLRLHPITIKKRYLLIIYLVATLGLWGFSFVNPTHPIVVFLHNSLDYHSPLTVVASVSVFLLFKGVNIKNTIIHNIICFVSSLTFGVYLFQDGYLKKIIFYDLLNISSFYNVQYSALAVLLLALELFLLGLAVELVRRGIAWLIGLVVKKIKNRKNKVTPETEVVTIVSPEETKKD